MNEKCFVLVSSEHIFGNKVNLAMKAIIVINSNFQVSRFNIFFCNVCIDH